MEEVCLELGPQIWIWSELMWQRAWPEWIFSLQAWCGQRPNSCDWERKHQSVEPKRATFTALPSSARSFWLVQGPLICLTTTWNQKVTFMNHLQTRTSWFFFRQLHFISPRDHLKRFAKLCQTLAEIDWDLLSWALKSCVHWASSLAHRLF